jgi:hypothetical protein
MNENEHIEQDEKRAELRRVRRLLGQIYRMAEHASMTGALANGAPDAVEKYNLVLRHLESKGYDVSILFPPLPDDASFDRVGVAARLLEGYLAEDAEEPSHRHGRHGVHGPHPPNVVIGNLHGLEELKDLGKTIRDNIAEALSGAGVKIKVKAEGSSTEDAQESPKAEENNSPTPMPDMSRQNMI